MKTSFQKLSLVKIFELLASSVAFISILTYFSGYQILSSFISFHFGKSYFLGSIIPPSIFTYLGLILAISICVAVPFFYMVVRGNLDKEYIRDGTIFISVMLLIILSLLGKPMNQLSALPKYQIVLVVLLALAILFCALMAIWKVIKVSYDAKGVAFNVVNAISESNVKYSLALTMPFLFPSLLIIVSNLYHGDSPLLISEINIGMYTNFYIEGVFSLIIITYFIKVVLNFKKEYYLLKVCLIVAYVVSFVYGYSTLTGKAIANSYIEKKGGIFPESKIILSESLGLPNEIKSKDNIEITMFTITKDSEYYYGFRTMKEGLMLIPISKIQSVRLLNSIK